MIIKITIFALILSIVIFAFLAFAVWLSSDTDEYRVWRITGKYPPFLVIPAMLFLTSVAVFLVGIIASAITLLFF